MTYVGALALTGVALVVVSIVVFIAASSCRTAYKADEYQFVGWCFLGVGTAALIASVWWQAAVS